MGSHAHEKLVHHITAILKDDPRVVAAWLEGSIARKEADDFSDVDLWVSVKDRSFDEWIEDREQFAAEIGPVLSVLYPREIEPEDDDIDSFHILLEDEPATAGIDVTVQRKRRPAAFVKDSNAQECAVLFDRDKVVRQKRFNPVAVEDYAEEVFEDVVVRFWHLLPRVAAHIARDDLLEAIAQYTERLEDVITMYRILYTPEKINWGFKDIEYDLPEDAIKHVYDLMPHPHAKALPKLTRQLAKTFYKEARLVGKRMKIPVDDVLAKQVISEL